MRGRVVAVGDPPIFRQQVASALDAPTESVVWMASLTAAEQLFGGESDAPDLIVISPAVDNGDALTLAQLANRFSPTTAVVLVGEGDRTAKGALSSFMRAGVRDVVNLKTDDLGDSLTRAIHWSQNLHSARSEEANDGASRGRVVTVFSSKGGSGKTFLASNLASAFAIRYELDTAIVDLDFIMGDVFAYFGSEPERSIRELIALGPHADRDSVMAYGTKLHELLHGFGAPADHGARPVPAEDVGNLLRALRRAFPMTVVDAPAGYTDEVLQALDVSDHVCVVATLDVVGIKHLAKMLETFNSIGFDREMLHVILNRADSKVGLDLADVERVTKFKIDALVPSSRLIPTSLNHGRPIYMEDASSPVSQSVEAIAARLVPDPAKQAQSDSVPGKRSLFGFSFGKA